ncbi:probable basic-leucine zipper transcription factor Q [Armigeres subalbatus]|uniref:probable basic-leucine zipper transcription factor Q n=1 Tax=Armigeres subalbatus TaxID=124917 RepID=UPI002ED61D34
MLTNIERGVINATNNNRAYATEIKNKLSAFLDTPPPDDLIVEKAVKSATAAAVEAMETTTISMGLIPQLINDLRSDLVPSSLVLTESKKLDELLDEVKHVSAAVSNLKQQQQSFQDSNERQKASEHLQQQQNQQSQQDVTNNAIMDLFAERRAKFSKLSNEAQSKKDLSSAGWRMLGNKWYWRPYWSTYDKKLNRQKLQEKAVDKARQRRKRRKQQSARISNKPPATFKDHTEGHMEPPIQKEQHQPENYQQSQSQQQQQQPAQLSCSSESRL